MTQSGSETRVRAAAALCAIAVQLPGASPSPSPSPSHRRRVSASVSAPECNISAPSLPLPPQVPTPFSRALSHSGAIALSLHVARSSAQSHLALDSVKGFVLAFLCFGRFYRTKAVAREGWRCCNSGLSPGYRRGTNPPSPSAFRRSSSSSDSLWRSLANRHKFLLYMLGLLTILCTVYLYFAITWGASDACSGLGGTQRAMCQLKVNRLKADSLKAHHRRLLNA